MINIFRRIRKKLVAGNPAESGANRPLKYARYAIGEIVLVVIGILIALQVNITVENGKEQKKVRALLQGIYTDLERDQDRMTFLYEFYQERASKMHFMVNIDTNGAEIPIDSLPEWFSKSLQYRKFLSKKSNYISLINEGLLNSIENKQLIDELISYYDTPYLTWSTEIYGEIINSIDFENAIFYDSRDRLNFRSSVSKIAETEYGSHQIRSNYNQVLTSKWAKDLLTSCLLQANTIFGNLETFKKRNKNLQNLIEKNR